MKKLAIIFCLLLSAISILGCANLSDNKANQAPMKSTSVDTAYLKKIHEKYFIASKKSDGTLRSQEDRNLGFKLINDKIIPEGNRMINELKQEKRTNPEEMIILMLLTSYFEARQKACEAIVNSDDTSLKQAVFEASGNEYYYNKSYYRLVENEDYQILTKERFNKLQKGYTYQEVSRKLAMPGKLEGTEMKGDRLVQTYVWHENSGANIKVKFIDNRMYSAEQSGLN